MDETHVIVAVGETTPPKGAHDPVWAFATKRAGAGAIRRDERTKKQASESIHEIWSTILSFVLFLVGRREIFFGDDDSELRVCAKNTCYEKPLL
jgi:hypothetical protein